MPQVITVGQCGDLLAVFVASRASADEAKVLAAEVGYRDSPLFGAAKKRLNLMIEVVCLYSAIVIHSANVAFTTEAAKPVIDAFLAQARAPVYQHIEAKAPRFSDTYSERLQEYFGIFRGENPPIGASFSMMAHLAINPLSNLKDQIWLAAKIGSAAAETVKILQGFTVIGLPDQPTADKDKKQARDKQAVEQFMQQASDWDGNAKLLAITLVGAVMGNKEAVASMGKDLTSHQLDTVVTLLKKMGDWS